MYLSFIFISFIIASSAEYSRWRYWRRAKTMDIYVSPCGSDKNEGTSSGSPMKTIEHALSLINTDSYKGNDIVIELMCGTCGPTCYFDLKSTLVITNKESRKLTIRTNKTDKVRVTGGQRIPWNKFKPVKYHKKIPPAALKVVSGKVLTSYQP
ncbi:uncharacterized protein LOC134717650 [Mytilus trossulus]|uniref:uncharacterized protein LOC134717650 n=1 Tax=Mytilus trossulus TaxID=6551 RepID=UPI0030075EC2